MIEMSEELMNFYARSLSTYLSGLNSKRTKMSKSIIEK